MRIRIAIVDDHPIMVNGLRYMLEACDELEVLGTYHCEEALFCSLIDRCPDLILDCCRHGRTGDVLVQRIRAKYPEVRILSLVSTGFAHCLRHVLKEKREGYLPAKTDTSTLVEAIVSVYYGDIYIDPVFKGTFETRRPSIVQTANLSKREKEILDLVIKGFTNIQISELLFLSIRTVENHRSRMLRKMNVKNSAEMVRSAMETGLV